MVLMAIVVSDAQKVDPTRDSCKSGAVSLNIAHDPAMARQPHQRSLHCEWRKDIASLIFKICYIQPDADQIYPLIMDYLATTKGYDPLFSSKFFMH